jgi:two-component system nitrogen regulation response regulator GlnG
MAAVLVVENDPFARKALGVLLSRAGLEVRLADGLASARAALAAEPCELIVSELLRPHGVSHLDALAKLRATYGETPTILATAEVEAQVWQPPAIGMAAVLVKPFDIDQFVDLVYGVLAQQRERISAMQTRSEATHETLQRTRGIIDQGRRLRYPPDDPGQPG